MDLQLREKTALVSGSTAGIGLSIAAALAREGARVYVNGRTAARVEEALRQIGPGSRPGELLAAPADLSTAAGVATLTTLVPSVDILVNNLGIYEAKPFEEITDADWLRIFEINVLSGIRLSRAYLPAMKQRNWGRVVFISSESAVNIPLEMIHYGMTKTAQVAVARGLAEGAAGTGVTVNSILAGPTRSEGVERFVEQMAAAGRTSAASVESEFFRNIRPSSLLKRFETPEEVAALVAFVCSPLASAINGAALRVEGGVVRSIL